MDLNKIPRWALVGIASLGLIATGTSISTARADLEKFKGIAYIAKNASEDALHLGADLKVQVSEIRSSQETFRKEYREDQKDLDRKLSEILRVVKS